MNEKNNYVGDILNGVIHLNKSGSGHLEVEGFDKDVYIRNKFTGNALHLDNVKVELTKTNKNKLEGVVININNRFKTEFVGTLELSKNFGFVVLDSVKNNVDFFIPIEKTLNAEDGDKVIVELINWKHNKKGPNGKIIKILGKSGENDVEIHSILHEYGLPYEFEMEVESEANNISTEITDEEISKRLDLRNILTFTIDPDTAKDFDDALSFEKLVNGNFKVGVHIADVSHYVKPGTELDKEAYNRGTSVYLVDRVVPMLPENLSNGLCSLRPNEDKLAFSVIFELTPNGDIINNVFTKTVINSNKRLTYAEAENVIIGSDNSFNENINYAITKLNDIAKKLRKIRFNDGTLDFNSREVKFKLDENKKPIGLTFKSQGQSNKLIEEYMLLANRFVGKFINDKSVTNVNRVHETPDDLKLSNLKDFLKQFDFNLKLIGVNIKDELNRLSKEFKDTDKEQLINNLVIRTMKKASYSTNNIGHYGLSFDDYVHFTSPIRRYPDVMIHRILNRLLNDYKPFKDARISSECQYLSNREVVAQKASRASIKFKQCEYLIDKIGSVFGGMITSITKFGVFVELDENKCDGLVLPHEIKGDNYIVDVDNYKLVGTNFGREIRLGDKVTVVIKEIDMEHKNIKLELLT